MAQALDKIGKGSISNLLIYYRDVDDLLTSGTKLEKIITVHPIIEPISAHLLYVAYNGWIYSGRLFWKIDKISLMEGRTGSYMTHCKSNEAETILRSGIPSEFKLLPGDCAVPPISPDYPLFLSPFNAKVSEIMIREQMSLPITVIGEILSCILIIFFCGKKD